MKPCQFKEPGRIIGQERCRRHGGKAERVKGWCTPGQCPGYATTAVTYTRDATDIDISAVKAFLEQEQERRAAFVAAEPTLAGLVDELDDDGGGAFGFPLPAITPEEIAKRRRECDPELVD